MNSLELIAEAERLESEAERALAASTKTARASGAIRDPRVSLLTCATSRPLLQQAKELRREAAELADPAADYQPPEATRPKMTEPTAGPTFKKAEVDAAIAAALASMRTAAAPSETAAQIAAREAKAREVETDALVASVTRWLPDNGQEAREREEEGSEEGDIAAAVAAWLPANRRAPNKAT